MLLWSRRRREVGACWIQIEAIWIFPFAMTWRRNRTVLHHDGPNLWVTKSVSYKPLSDIYPFVVSWSPSLILNWLLSSPGGLMSKRADVSTHWRPNGLTSQCLMSLWTDVPMDWCPNGLMSQQVEVLTGWRPNGLMSQWTDVPMDWCPNGLMSQWTNVPMDWCPNGLMSQQVEVLTGWRPNGLKSPHADIQTGWRPRGLTSHRTVIPMDWTIY